MEFLGMMAGLFGLDIYLKGKIESEKAENFPRELEGTGGRIFLYRNHNDGFCFGFLRKNRELLRTLPLVFTSAAAGVYAWLLTRKGSIPEKLGFSLVVAGAASNLFDRLKRGYVVDYFSFRFGFLKKVVFNIADLCIFLGTAILAAHDMLRKED